MSKKYILNGRIPCLEPDIIKWARWLESVDRSVKSTRLPSDVRISTVFLGIDHRFMGHGPPILFETMIFGGPHGEYRKRYCTWEDAEAGHDIAVELAKSGENKSERLIQHNT